MSGGESKILVSRGCLHFSLQLIASHYCFSHGLLPSVFNSKDTFLFLCDLFRDYNKRVENQR